MHIFVLTTVTAIQNSEQTFVYCDMLHVQSCMNLIRLLGPITPSSISHSKLSKCTFTQGRSSLWTTGEWGLTVIHKKVKILTTILTGEVDLVQKLFQNFSKLNESKQLVKVHP